MNFACVDTVVGNFSTLRLFLNHYSRWRGLMVVVVHWFWLYLILFYTCRFCQRILPVTKVCHASVRDIQRQADSVLQPHFHMDSLIVHKVYQLRKCLLLDFSLLQFSLFSRELFVLLCTGVTIFWYQFANISLSWIFSLSPLFLQFAVNYKARNNNDVNRDEIIKLVAGMVVKNGDFDHKVDLNNPDLTIVVEIIKVLTLELPS